MISISGLALILSVLITGSLSFIFLHQVLEKAGRWGFVDRPSLRKKRQAPIPRLGGLVLFPGILIGAAITLILKGQTAKLLGGLIAPIDLCFAVLVGSLSNMILGLIDDRKGLQAHEKLVVQMITSFVCLQAIPVPSHLFGVSLDPVIFQLFFFFWLMIIPNSVNLLDGLDGLSTLLFIGFFLTVSTLWAAQGATSPLLISVPILTSLFVFIRYNWNPAKIYLGDSGSQSIGFLIAYFSLISGMDAHLGSITFNPAITFVLTSIWLLDTAMAVGRRFFRWLPNPSVFVESGELGMKLVKRSILNIVKGDLLHLHHKLLHQGWTVKQSSILIAVVAFGWMSLSLTIASENITIQSLAWMMFVISTGGVLMTMHRHMDIQRSLRRRSPKKFKRLPSK
ncbi:MAG: hypothetical protein COV44_11225 [Deltaproteobacteria bacterium CG11_big_fil_rev_8_21_14_0_20_45_16]|nr:MAG: hypothetical protein COV44_11225 [Deltaproteobacteria bacterium CG11_big_fil_rev_8_21_14_0_20_45_16]